MEFDVATLMGWLYVCATFALVMWMMEVYGLVLSDLKIAEVAE